MRKTDIFPCVVNLYDAAEHRFVAARLAMQGEGVSLERLSSRTAVSRDDDTAIFMSPGWIDMHAHVCDGIGWLSVPPDPIGLDQGVFVIGDAGSCGADTFSGVKKYIIPATRTTIKIWLNINSIGLVHMPEYFDERLLDPGKAAACCREHPDIICGMKTRISGSLMGDLGIKPLMLAKRAAIAAKLPLMVHVGEPPPDIPEILNQLDAGDIVTHCFHGGAGSLWEEDGSPIPALRSAVDRGVRLDVGNGRLSFSFERCERALGAGERPVVSISSDIHANSAIYVKGLATVMSKLLLCGYPLAEVVRGVTTLPAQAMGLGDWCDAPELLRHATLFMVARARNGETYYDATFERRRAERIILPIGIVKEGVFHATGS